MSLDKIFRFCTKCGPVLAVFKQRYNRCSNKDEYVIQRSQNPNRVTLMYKDLTESF